MLNRNKKKITASLGRQPKYIYTEADLGEGILDVGVPLTHKITQRESKVAIGGSLPDCMLVAANIQGNLEIPSVGEDFSYVYYY